MPPSTVESVLTPSGGVEAAGGRVAEARELLGRDRRAHQVLDHEVAWDGQHADDRQPDQHVAQRVTGPADALLDRRVLDPLPLVDLALADLAELPVAPLERALLAQPALAARALPGRPPVGVVVAALTDLGGGHESCRRRL